MRNITGEPYAFKELNEETGEWSIHFDPCPRMDGYHYYETITGFIDSSNASLIVELLLKEENFRLKQYMKNES